MTDQKEGAVEIRPCGEQLCGHVYAIIRVPDPQLPLADNRNQDSSLRKRPLCGLPILGGLQQQSDDSWIDGWIYDPNVGRTFRLDLSLQDPETLAVHGYIGARLLGRTVLWRRADPGMPRCRPPSQ